MAPALIVLGGIVYIGLSLYFRFTPRLRVVIGLIVGGLLAGVVAEQVTHWLGKGTGTLARPVGRFIGQSAEATAAAIPTVTAFALAVVVIVFLRGRTGGAGGKGATGTAGKGSGKGGGGKGGALAHAALGCAVLLPIIAASVGDAVRSVTS
jgi:uncharacterized membrane protein YgcG